MYGGWSVLRRIFLICVLLLPLTFLALQVPDALQLYLQLVREYESGSIQHPFLIQVEESLRHLSLYRFYRFLIAGSVDKREATPDLGYYLGLIYSSYSFESEEEQLAGALFLSYLSSKLSKTRLAADQVMKNASFIDFFTRYRDVVSREARTFFSWIIAYQLGLTNERPPVNVQQRFQLELSDYVFTPPSDLKHLPDLTQFYEDPSIQAILDQAVSRAFENIQKDPARVVAHINRESAFVARDIVKPITSLQASVAQMVQKLTPNARNYWWLRFVVYALVLLVTFRYLKIRNIALSGILVFESVYLFFLFDPTSRYESMAYGLVLLLGLAFAILRLPKRRSKLFEIVSIALIVLSLIVPLVPRCEELSMDRQESFLESKYYDLLKRELYVDELSRAVYYVRRLSSTMYTSLEDTKAVIDDLVERLSSLNSKGVITEIVLTPRHAVFFNDRSNFFSYSNASARLGEFQPLSGTLRFYLLDEKSRMRSFRKDLDALLKYSKRLVSYSAPKLRDEFRQHVQDLFNVKYPILSDLLPTFDREVFQASKDVRSPHINVFNNRYSLSVLLVLLLVFLTGFFLSPKISLGPSVILLAGSVWAWLSSHELILIVEQTSPVLILQTRSFVNPLLFLTAIFLVAINVFKLFRRGESV